MGARHTRPSIGRGFRRTGWHFGPHLETDHAQAERDAAAGAAVALAADAALQERVVHPVVAAPERKAFRVIRLFLLKDHLSFEDIGHPANAREALAISTREQWRAQVLNPNGKVFSDKRGEMERR